MSDQIGALGPGIMRDMVGATVGGVYLEEDGDELLVVDVPVPVDVRLIYQLLQRDGN